MATNEFTTDLWVAKMLENAEINFSAQGSTVKEIDQALKTASKSGK